MDASKKAIFIKDWILNYVNSMPKKAESLVIGISGGIDSSVSSTLSAMTGLKTIVFIPVRAHRVLDTDESIPPEIPITKDLALAGIESTYFCIQFFIKSTLVFGSIFLIY